MPTAVADFLAAQLEIADPSLVKSYAQRQATQWEHAAEIRREFGYRDFGLGSVRERNYRHEMRDETEHRALADALHECVATVVVSGYASELYDRELFADWYRHELPSATTQGGTWGARTEVLWSNRPLNIPDRRGQRPVHRLRVS